MKYYIQGRLVKCCETDNTDNTTTNYTHNDKGQLTTTLSMTEKNGQSINEAQTGRLHDPRGYCIFEVKINPKTRTDFYHHTCRIGIDGGIKSGPLKYIDGRYTVSSYDKQGLLTETKEYNKNREMEGYIVNKYDDKGRMTESQHQNMLFVNSPDQILSQKELYECDKYGYLTRIICQRIFGNSQKTSGCLTHLYDEYGNRIDGDSYYEYGNTGRWICRTSYNNPQ